MNIKINEYEIGLDHPTFFIADIAANHDGDLEKAKELIWLSAEAGADCAKFQHFDAETIVSDFGFKNLGSQQSHQKTWKKSVFETYKEASLNREWTAELKQTCDQAGIVFMTSPYSKELVDYVDQYVPAYKIGSGDVTWLEIIDHIANKNKPVFLATGASDLSDVSDAMKVLSKKGNPVVLMQCNTNYTASENNLEYINLNVISTYSKTFPDVILGLSDHTHGCTSVLGSVALGSRVIEKHFTDSCERDGPDHKFSMDPTTWREMVDRTRELESCLGNGIKIIEDNEQETVVLQRRALRATKSLKSGEIIKESDFFPLRPCPQGALQPADLDAILNKTLKNNVTEGDVVKWEDLI
tara:strand:+ start:503 stop:1567 length:1065 start_codon:yes stop_codon:yes gene_type:complete